MTAATVVQVLYVLLQLSVVAAVMLSFKFYCKFYCMFYFTCDRFLTYGAMCTPHFVELVGWQGHPPPKYAHCYAVECKQSKLLVSSCLH